LRPDAALHLGRREYVTQSIKSHQRAQTYIQ
jgi:hypothetical protein